MSRAEAYRGSRHVALVAALVAATLVSVSCARRGPPAPLDDRTGIYYASPAKPKTAAVKSAPAAPAARSGKPSVSPAPERRAPVTSAELPPPPAARPQPATPVQPPPESAPAAPLPAGGVLTTTEAGKVTVRSGDTLFAISRRENIPIRALIDANDLKPPYRLLSGQTLRVPGLRVYTVAAGDTVYGISRRYDVGLNDVIRQNALTAPDFPLYVGQRLVLPVEEEAVPEPAASSQTAVLRLPPRSDEPLGDPNADPPPRAGSKFLWPVRGKIVSSFGAKGGGLYNDGINIAAEPGEIVRAAENGVVAYAGNELRGYGNMLLVRHSGGWISAYAHNGELLVRRGQTVKRGQPIARVGNSGAVATPQLHFELRRGRKAVDPRPHLS